MKKYMMIMLATMMVSSGFAKDDYKAKMDAFVSNLLGKMTVDEKIGQLNLTICSEFVSQFNYSP